MVCRPHAHSGEDKARMNLDIYRGDDATILRLSGDLDSDSNPLLREQLRELVDEVENALLIDMTGVRYLNSAILGSFIQAYRLLGEKSIPMRFYGMTRKVKSIFLITKLDGILDIYDDEKEAMKSLPEKS